jgi:uncharacterized protein YggE
MRWITLAAIVVFAALAAPATAQQDAAPAAARSTILNVNASGVSVARPDMAVINAGVTTQANTAQASLAENAERMTALVGALRRAGIAERDIQTSWVRVNPRYRHRDGHEPEVIGYEAANTVRAKIRNIDHAGRVIDAVVGAGGNTVHGISFGHQAPEAQLDVARRDAIAVARQRADLYAQALGMRVQRVISVTEAGAAAPSFDDEIIVTGTRLQRQGFQAQSPVAPGELETRANVSVSFELR